MTEVMTYGLCPLHGSECRGEMCAWWDPLERGCAVCAIASSMLQLQGVIDVSVRMEKESPRANNDDGKGTVNTPPSSSRAR